MKYMVRLENGEEFGPADINLLCEWMKQRRIPKSAMLVPDDGSEPVSALSLPELAAVYQPQPPPSLSHPPIEPTAPVQTTVPGDEPMSVMIPYRNTPALVAYYFAVFSLIPALGVLLGIVAFVLGIIGLRLRKRDPNVHGSVHAWIGIIIGGGLALVQIGVFFFFILAA